MNVTYYLVCDKLGDFLTGKNSFTPYMTHAKIFASLEDAVVAADAIGWKIWRILEIRQVADNTTEAVLG